MTTMMVLRLLLMMTMTMLVISSIIIRLYSAILPIYKHLGAYQRSIHGKGARLTLLRSDAQRCHLARGERGWSQGPKGDSCTNSSTNEPINQPIDRTTHAPSNWRSMSYVVRVFVKISWDLKTSSGGFQGRGISAMFGRRPMSFHQLETPGHVHQ